MFNTEFTFNTSVGYGQNDTTQIVTDKQIEKLMNKNKNILFKKDITFEFHKQLIFKKGVIGLGDVIDFITKITGIKWLIIKLTKGNCGCEKRRVLFNKWLTIPYFYAKLTSTLYDDYFIVDSTNDKKYKNRVINPKPTGSNPITPKKGCGCGRKK